MGIAGTYRHKLKAKYRYTSGIQKPGVQRGVATLPLQNHLMPSGILGCILLQASRRDSLTGLETSLSDMGESAGEISLSGKDDT